MVFCTSGPNLVIVAWTGVSYRNWPWYSLCWSGLCGHSGILLMGLAPPALCQNGSTNHYSADCMSGQFIFYHENEAMHCDKCSKDEPTIAVKMKRHAETSLAGNGIVMKASRIISQYGVTIASGSCIDDVTITQLFSFEIISGAIRNEQYEFQLFKVTRRSKI